MLRRFFAFVAVIVFSANALAQLPPDKALATMQVANGLQVELFAAEPMLINPTSIDVDHLGRVWVCEAVNYRCFLRNRPLYRDAGDRIVILTDKDGDGKADDSTVFYQGKELIAPIGIAVAPIAPTLAHASGSACRVFVCQSPDILLFDDLDGDGKADGPPKKFLSGFKGFDHDHGVHGINIGPDGKLYFTVGDAGVDGLKSSDGKGRVWKSNSTDVRAGTVWRCDMDGKNLELIAHNFRNNYECCVNSFGEIWLSDNDDDGNQQTRICHVMPGGNYGYHPRGPGQTHWHEEQPGIVHKVIRTGFGSPTGICFNEGTLLPKKYHGQLLHTDAGPRELRVFHLKPKGAGYEAEKEVLLTSTDNWFRPSDVCVAPDGSLIVADWYDPGVGGHGMGDTTRGRIYRVTPKGHAGYKVGKVDVTTLQGTLDGLRSPCLAVRAVAITKVRTMNAEDCESFAQSAVYSKDSTLIARVGAALSEHIQSQDWRLMTKELLRAFNDEILMEIGVRLIANRILAQDDKVQAEFASFSASFLAKLPTSVRREYLIALRLLLPSSDTLYSLAKLYDGQDRFYLAALNIACGTEPERRAKILADFDKHFPELNDKTLDLIWELRPLSAIAKLDQKLLDTKLTAAQKGRILDILANSDAAAGGQTVLKLLEDADTPAELKAQAWKTLVSHLPNKWSALKGAAQLDRLLAKWMVNSPIRERIWALELIALAEKRNLASFLSSVAKNEQEPREIRLAAMKSMVVFKTKLMIETLSRLIVEPELRPTAIAALGQMQTPEALGVLQKLLGDANANADAQKTAVVALAGTRPGTDWLLKLKEDGKMPEAIVADAGRLLRNSPFQGQRNKALLLFPPAGKLDPKKLPAIATLAKRSGNVENGRKLMAASAKNEAQCLKCHTIRGIGGAVGPDLSMIGKKASRENLLESIISPSKAIADQYIQHVVETDKGKQIVGLMVQNGLAFVIIRDANGKDHTIQKMDIESQSKSNISIMADNLVAALTEDELIDVVEYMFTLKTPSLTPEYWHIVGPFPNDSNDAGLDKDFGPEKGVDLSATYQSPKRERGRAAWTRVQRNGEGYVDLMAHYAPNSANITSYLYREIESTVDQEATLLIGTDDGAKVWLNGKEVFSTRAHRAAAPEQDRVKVTLKKGTNSVLIKIVNGAGPHGLYFSVLAAEEVKAGK